MNIICVVTVFTHLVGFQKFSMFEIYGVCLIWNLAGGGWETTKSKDINQNNPKSKDIY